MLNQAVLALIWFTVTFLVALRCTIRRTSLWTSMLLVLIAVPAMDKNMFPDPVDPMKEYMRMTKDLPYQLGDWRIDIKPVCCFKDFVPMYKLQMYRSKMD